jgi:hypothetical protein
MVEGWRMGRWIAERRRKGWPRSWSAEESRIDKMAAEIDRGEKEKGMAEELERGGEQDR